MTYTAYHRSHKIFVLTLIIQKYKLRSASSALSATKIGKLFKNRFEHVILLANPIWRSFFSFSAQFIGCLLFPSVWVSNLQFILQSEQLGNSNKYSCYWFELYLRFQLLWILQWKLPVLHFSSNFPHLHILQSIGFVKKKTLLGRNQELPIRKE